MADEPNVSKPLNILDIDFEVSQPYSAGHTLTDAEAKALNQVRRENLGNNFRGTVKKAQEEAAAAGKELDVSALQSQFADLDTKYVFTIREVNATAKMDPVEREARNLVKAALRAHFASLDPAQKFSDLSEEDQEKLIEINVANPDVQKAAKTIVKQKSSIGSINLGGESAPADQTAA